MDVYASWKRSVLSYIVYIYFVNPELNQDVKRYKIFTVAVKVKMRFKFICHEYHKAFIPIINSLKLTFLIPWLRYCTDFGKQNCNELSFRLVRELLLNTIAPLTFQFYLNLNWWIRYRLHTHVQ